MIAEVRRIHRDEHGLEQEERRHRGRVLGAREEETAGAKQPPDFSANVDGELSREGRLTPESAECPDSAHLQAEACGRGGRREDGCRRRGRCGVGLQIVLYDVTCATGGARCVQVAAAAAELGIVDAVDSW